MALILSSQNIGQAIMLVLCILFVLVALLQGKILYRTCYQTGTKKALFYWYILCEVVIVAIVTFILVGLFDRHALDAFFRPTLSQGF